MSAALIRLLGELTALAAGVALSPFSVIPAIALVAQSARPRVVGIAFVAGWLAGKAAITLAFVAVPRLLHTVNQPAPGWANWLRIIAGVAFCLAAVWAWRKPMSADAGSPTWLGRLTYIGPSAAVMGGVAMTVVNVKVTALCAAAGYAIGTHQLTSAEIGLTTVYFTALAGSSAALPILAYTLFPGSVDGYLTRFRLWMQRRQRPLTVGALALIGVALTATGIAATM
ncbi:GAP family protein [Mycolicibacterium septicum]|uniref:GAP family protein n=1 Tax=Mycolicibacterium septicum TaxID=98668 RepID=UPI001AF067B5|nr:GAP family protein [Mycolicibacterium septicum]QRY54522.1 GAP family protein [Mycolicibacterium septicum]